MVLMSVRQLWVWMKLDVAWWALMLSVEMLELGLASETAERWWASTKWVWTTGWRWESTTELAWALWLGMLDWLLVWKRLGRAWWDKRLA